MEIKKLRRRKVKRRQWTNEEDVLLSELVRSMDVNQMSISDIALMLNRTEGSVKGRMATLFLSVPKKRFSLYEGDKYIAEGTREELAELMGWQTNTVSQHFKRTKESPNKRKFLVYEVEERMGFYEKI